MIKKIDTKILEYLSNPKDSLEKNELHLAFAEIKRMADIVNEHVIPKVVEENEVNK